MVQSTSQPVASAPPHVAIIMDGNGRWATDRGMPRVAGHRAGVEAVRRAVEAAPRLGIDTLTLFAFSADNWGRPQPEVAALMAIFEDYLRNEREHLVAMGVAAKVIGRRDRFSISLRNSAEETEALTLGGSRLELRIAIDYSGRQAILEAARRLQSKPSADREDFSRLLGETIRADASRCDIDLLIRTGGEQRLSDLPLWEVAYAELYFTERMWPEFTGADLEEALRDFRRRERRFGRLPEPGGDPARVAAGTARPALAATPTAC